MILRLSLLGLGALLPAGLLAVPAHADVLSTFDQNDEGWLIYGDAQGASVNPTYRATGGNPGGFVEARDNVTGGVWYFSAPEKFLGNQSAAYGTLLTFDLWQSSRSSQFNNSDVVLVGAGLTLAFDTAYNPDTDWTSYTVPLEATDAAQNWRLNDLNGAAASEQQIRDVLASLTALRIRGEFVSGADTGGLDNVRLVPEPASVALFGLGGLLLLNRRRLA